MHTTDLKEALKITMHPNFDALLRDIAFDFGIPGNVTLTRVILKLQATINTLEASQRLMQERVAALETALASIEAKTLAPEERQ